MDFLRSLDWSTYTWFQWQTRHRPRLNAVMLDLTTLGGESVLTVVVLFALGFLLALRRYRTAGFVLAAVIGGVLLMDAIKAVVGRERPPEPMAGLVYAPHSPSFPSGHAMVSAVVYLTLALVAAPAFPGRRVRAYLVGSSLVLVFLVGLSRIYLGVHFVTDVLAGWLGGLAWALGCRWLEENWVLAGDQEISPGGEREALTPCEAPRG
jgi:undecaprenyl-diphosphatase